MPLQINVSDPWLIIGADGLIGSMLRRDWCKHGFSVAATSLRPLADNQGAVILDLSQPAVMWPDLPRCRVAVIAAAITNLEQCRQQPAATREVNVAQTVRLAERLAEQGAFVVFISSNLVFDGTRPCRQPAERVCPVSEYGRQKAEAEAALLKLGERCAVVRLTKVFHGDLGLIKAWREQLRKGQIIRPFSDYLCAPITLDCVTEAIRLVAQSSRSGIWQVSASEDISYAEIAAQLAGCGGFDAALVQPTTAPRDKSEHLPRFTTLDTRQLEETFDFHIPSARQTVEAILKAG